MSITLTGTAAINYLQAENAKLTAKVAELTAKVAEQDQWKNTILNEGEDYKLMHPNIPPLGEDFELPQDKGDYPDDLEEICYQGVEYGISKDGIVYNENLEVIGKWEFSIITFISKEAQSAHESHESYEQPGDDADIYGLGGGGGSSGTPNNMKKIIVMLLTATPLKQYCKTEDIKWWLEGEDSESRKALVGRVVCEKVYAMEEDDWEKWVEKYVK